MRRALTNLTTLTLASLSLLACSSGEKGAADSASTTAAADSVASAATPADNAAVAPANIPAGAATAMHVVMTGGKDPGTYDAFSMDRTCSVGTNEQDQWSNQFTDDKATSGLSSLQLTIPSVAKAKAGTSEFNAGFSYGSLMQSRDYIIETRPTVKPNRGSGTVKVEDTGATAVITIKGQTADGVTIDATVRCNKVARGR
ncbi:MAG: hypothetical protein WKG32_09495 [Gemmatimonadaceae bacterium]